MIDCPECEICCAIQLCCPADSPKQRISMAWAIQQQHTHLNDDQAFAAADRVLEHFHFFQDMPRLIVGPS